jgi:DNA-binding CsgD family transcriptional regulator
MPTHAGRAARHGWAAMPESVRSAAQARCTPMKLDALKFTAAGYGARRVGRILGISPQAYKSRLDGAMLKIRDELDAPGE